MGKKLIKWIGLVLTIVVLISLYFYVGDKKRKKRYAPDDALKLATWQINERQDYPAAIEILEDALPAAGRYADLHAVLGKAYLLNHSIDSAKKELLVALRLDRKNEAALLNLVSLSLLQHDTAAAIRYTDQFLHYYPHDKALLTKKYILQLQTRDYTAARHLYDSLSHTPLADTLRSITAYYWSQRTKQPGKTGEPAGPGALQQLQDLANSIKATAADEAVVTRTGHRNNINPEIITPSHAATRDALLQEINTQLAAENYNNALLAVNRALVLYPNDRDLINKKTGILLDTKNYALAIAFIESLPVRDNRVYIKMHTDITLQQAAVLRKEKDLPGAIAVIEQGIRYNPADTGLLLQALNAYAAAGRTNDAVSMADKLVAAVPANPAYRFKKAGLLETQDNYEAAAAITHELMRQYPADTRFRTAFIGEITMAEKKALAAGQPGKTILLFNELAGIADPGKLAFQYAIAAYTEEKKQQQATDLLVTALNVYPGDSLFMVKKAIALQLLDRHPEALTISRELTGRYPQDRGLQQLYLDQLFAAGKYYERGNRMDTALAIFHTAHLRSPEDTFALENLSAIYFTRKQYDSSIYFAKLGLTVDSNNVFLLTKLASAYEQLKEYPKAMLAASRAAALQPLSVKPGYLDHLRSKTFLNQLGVMHLQSVFSSPGQFSSVTGIRYMRRFKGGSVGTLLNFGQRPAGNGVQGGLDLYLTHNTRYYSNIFVNASTGTAFPYWQLGYSLYRNLPKDWEIELGGRYLGFDTAHIFTAVGAVAKYMERTWLNLRGFYTRDASFGYASAVFTFRQYLNEKRDYLSFVAGTGKTPDDPGLINNFANYRGYRTATVGLGFQKVFRYRTFLQGSVSYTNLSIATKRSINQYDFYLSLFRNF